MVGWPPPQGEAGRAGDTLRTTKREHQAERLIAIRLRYCANTHFQDQGIATPAQIGAATGLPAAAAVRPLARRQWRAGDAAALQAVAGRLGFDVPLEGFAPAARMLPG